MEGTIVQGFGGGSYFKIVKLGLNKFHFKIFVICFQEGEGEEETELNCCERLLSEAKKKISWPFSKLWSGIKAAVSWIKEKYDEKFNDSKKEYGEVIQDLFDEEKVKNVKCHAVIISLCCHSVVMLSLYHHAVIIVIPMHNNP